MERGARTTGGAGAFGEAREEERGAAAALGPNEQDGGCAPGECGRPECQRCGRRGCLFELGGLLDSGATGGRRMFGDGPGT